MAKHRFRNRVQDTVAAAGMVPSLFDKSFTAASREQTRRTMEFMKVLYYGLPAYKQRTYVAARRGPQRTSSHTTLAVAKTTRYIETYDPDLLGYQHALAIFEELGIVKVRAHPLFQHQPEPMWTWTLAADGVVTTEDLERLLPSYQDLEVSALCQIAQKKLQPPAGRMTTKTMKAVVDGILRHNFGYRLKAAKPRQKRGADGKKRRKISQYHVVPAHATGPDLLRMLDGTKFAPGVDQLSAQAASDEYTHGDSPHP